MNYYVLTLFPEMIEQGMNTSITGRAIENGQISLKAVNIRDYADNKHMKVDDYPYGGGAGMVMQAEPVYQACQAVTSEMEKKPRVIYMTPQAKVFTQELAKELAEEENLIFLCGHYEGIDERVLEEVVTDYLSIGDYVLTGGELPAMVVMDAISRLVPGVLNNEISAETESFSDNLLEHPHYSRPPVWHEKAVPEVLMSGHHKNIETWRREQSILRTLKRRPELLEKAPLTKKEEDFIKKHLQSE
ncbi:tRNA (guanosine(37)-N1)-methyltransferase TrmD [Acetivibrio ethanolgignens]|uniref:tRNA (guanine-N(1)-)-methyltransferase n=1 Tax=Acetivibrio ethanolgignens TaxID=290052 RepID=A0A0V8QHB5_9FIRM|nr:tRNA (guanosine(37)-N1)-methyltransferase TrmD [Acetivibrio ethanolgignens]KSV59967.1 tRNA (guanine-N1)-methyltransferase [Acetivibrio ethanolgignens]